MRVKVVFAPGLVPDEDRRLWYAVPTGLETVSDLADDLSSKFSLSRSLRLSCDGFALPSVSDVSLIRDGDTIEVRRESSRRESCGARQSVPEAAQEAAEEAEAPRQKKRRRAEPASAASDPEAAAVEPPAAPPAEEPEAPQPAAAAVSQETPAKKRRRHRKSMPPAVHAAAEEQQEAAADEAPRAEQRGDSAQAQEAAEAPQGAAEAAEAEAPREKPAKAAVAEQPQAPSSRAAKEARAAEEPASEKAASAAESASDAAPAPAAAAAEQERRPATIIPAQVGKKIVFDDDGGTAEVDVERDLVITGRKTNKRRIDRIREAGGAALQPQAPKPQQPAEQPASTQADEGTPERPRRRQRRQRQRALPADTTAAPAEAAAAPVVPAAPAASAAPAHTGPHELTATRVVLNALQPPESAPAHALTFPREYEKLPALTQMPWVGDIIAYKTLELSSNFTPEMSDWKEAKVIAVDANEMTLEVTYEANKPILPSEGLVSQVPEPAVVSARLDMLSNPRVLKAASRRVTSPQSQQQAATASTEDAASTAAAQQQGQQQQQQPQEAAAPKEKKVWRFRGLGSLVSHLKRQSSGQGGQTAATNENAADEDEQ
eukprot:m51a1_g4370 hypothetical protein (603) ;mRNA; f:309337-311478